MAAAIARRVGAEWLVTDGIALSTVPLALGHLVRNTGIVQYFVGVPAQMRHGDPGRISSMPQWVWLVAILVGYLVLTQWLLPKLGVPT